MAEGKPVPPVPVLAETSAEAAQSPETGPRKLPPEVVTEVNATLELMMKCSATIDQMGFHQALTHLRGLLRIPGQEKLPEIWNLPGNVQQIVVALYLGLLNNASAVAGVFQVAKGNLKKAAGGLLGPDGEPV